MKIPVQFEYEGKTISGTLSEIGTGRDQWQLMIDNYYWGRLRRVGDAWYFDAGKLHPDPDMVNYFASVVIAWYQ